jgi:glycosyltransferase involved in cell wall biosynthesis
MAKRFDPAEPPRLLLAAPNYYPVYSGAAERFRRYLPGFIARGVEVSVFSGTPTPEKANGVTPKTPWVRFPLGGLLPREQVDGIPVHRVRLPDSGEFRRALWFVRGVRAFCRDAPFAPNVVQMFGTAAVSLPELWRLKRMGIPIVATRTMMPALPTGTLKRRLRQMLMRIPSGLVTCEVVGSHAMLEAFRRIGIGQPVEIIPHGVDTKRFRPARNGAERTAMRLRLGIPDGAVVILFAGSIEPRKGVHRLLQAWCRLAAERPDLHLVIAGPRWELAAAAQAYNRYLERLVKESDAQDRLHLPGIVHNIEELMRAADVFVLPSSREGMPNVMGEAMASGLPVVATPFIGLSREFGEAGIHYMSTGFEPEAIASDMATLLDAPERRMEIGRRGRDWVEQNLDVETSIDRYVALYQELIRNVVREIR